MEFLSVLGWIVVCGILLKEAVEANIASSNSRERAINDGDKVYTDGNGNTRIVGSPEKVYRSHNERGDIVYKSIKTNMILFNETEMLSYKKKMEAISAGKEYYLDHRPGWPEGAYVEIATGNVYHLENKIKGIYYRWNYEEVDCAGRIILRKAYKGEPISKEEFIRLGGHVLPHLE